ncbi:outer membrane beta-barrel protein [Luteimonas sp. MC1828]|nr:outer membrane beta-barrel protein [Luteimonas sp. MC1828]
MHCSSFRMFAPAVLLLLALAPGAHAQDAGTGGAYVGASVGNADVEGYDRDDTAYSLRGGYRFNRYLAVEASYADLGEIAWSFGSCIELCAPESAVTHYSLANDRWDVAMLGLLPLGRQFELFARLGYARAGYDVGSSNMLGSATYSRNDSTETYGVGARFHFDAPWTLRLEWERLRDVGDAYDIDTLWLGAEYRFQGR